MKFWDASALVPLLVAEPTTQALQALAIGDGDMLVWWGSRMECVSVVGAAGARLGLRWHAGPGGARAAGGAGARLARDRSGASWCGKRPLRFLRVHPLRAADALQLAAAFVAAESRPSAPGSGDSRRPPRGGGTQGGLRPRGG
ncbi:MAG: hypothetical protein WDN31_00785 [Hyphomicrobium sp.]